MFTLKLVTPQKKLLEGAEVKDVFVPAYRGELQILPGHAPLVTTLTAGVLKYHLKDSDKLESVAISWGYCQVSPTGVTVMAETAELAQEINLVAAQKDRADALDALSKVTYDGFEAERLKFEQAEARINAAKSH